MKVIFLDVDGVLTHALFKKTKENLGLDEEKIKLLKEIVDQTNAKIVLCSSWKNTPRPLEKLKETLKKYDLEIYDKTPNIKPITKEPLKQSYTLEELTNIKIYEETTRAGEINNWIKNHNVESFIILDDGESEYIFFNYQENHIKTYDNKGGLLKEDVEKAVEILNDKNQIKTRKRNQ